MQNLGHCISPFVPKKRGCQKIDELEKKLYLTIVLDYKTVTS